MTATCAPASTSDRDQEATVTAPDPTIATVRVLTGATTADIDDPGIAALLAEEGGVAKLAAADVLELMAGTLMTVDSDDMKLDGSKRAATLMARAKALRDQYYEHGGDFYFDSAPLGPNPYLHLGPGYTDFQWGYTADEVI